MPGDEDDLGFTALDDNIVGDGATDATTKPADTMLEAVTDARHKAMWHRGSSVEKAWYNPSGPEASPRPFTSRDQWAAIAVIPWEVRPGLDELHVSLKAEVGNDDSNTAGEVALRLELITPGGSRKGPKQETTATATGGITAYTITLDLSDQSFAPGVSLLALWVKSTADAQIGDEAIATDGDTGSTTFIQYEDGASTDSAIDEKSAIRLPDFGDFGSGGALLPLHKSTVVFGDHRTGVTADVSQSNSTTGGFASPIVNLSWVKPQSVAIYETYDKETAGAFVAKTPASIEPQRPIKGADAATHPETLDGIVRRPKCRAIGPHGQDQGADWPTDYYRQWSWIETEGESDTLLDRASFRRMYGSSDIRCIAYVKPFFDIKILNDSFAQSDRQYRAAPSNPADFGNFVITADLDLTLTVRQAQSSDTWDNQPSTSTTRTVRDVSLHYAMRQPGYPLANTVFWARHPTSEKSFTDDATSSEYRYTFYEGALFREDLDLFSQTGFSISIDPTDGIDLSPGAPIRCDLEFGGWSQGPNLDEIDEPSGDTEVSYHLLCMGTSWWEMPQV